MGGRVVLGEVIRLVVFSFVPKDSELTAVGSVLEPVEAHVHGLGSLDLDRVVGNAFCGSVVSLNGSGSCLRVADFFEEVAQVRLKAVEWAVTHANGHWPYPMGGWVQLDIQYGQTPNNR